jgi:hypothetical protein
LFGKAGEQPPQRVLGFREPHDHTSSSLRAGRPFRGRALLTLFSGAAGQSNPTDTRP